MKNCFLISILLALAAATAFASTSTAEPKTQTAPVQAAAEPLGENEPIPFMRTEQAAAAEGPSSAGLLLKTVASMAFIVGLIFFGAWGAKKLGFGTKAGSTGIQDLAVLTSVSLGNSRTVSTIRFGQRILLVGSTPQSFTLLAEEDGEVVSEPAMPRSVAELLAEDTTPFKAALKHAESALNKIIPGGKAS
ncbi:MAG: flagellar biosynthetic protein FliO [Acidobacteria bacterium]|nr:flagellar biosynthetic protein FliO [Acidobacteriota bacterium]